MKLRVPASLAHEVGGVDDIPARGFPTSSACRVTKHACPRKYGVHQHVPQRLVVYRELLKTPSLPDVREVSSVVLIVIIP